MCGCGGSAIFDQELQAYVCPQCGLVLNDHPILPVEGGSEDYVPRVSGYVTNRVHNRGVGGTVIPGAVRMAIEGQRWATRNLEMSASEKRVRRLLEIVNVVGKLARAPLAVRETAALVARKGLERLFGDKSFVREELLRKLAVASVYVAMRIHGHHVSVREYAKTVRMDANDLVRVASKLGARLAPVNLQNYALRIASQMSIPQDVIELSLKILSHLPGTFGKSPISVASASIYIASILLDKAMRQKDFENYVSEAGVASGVKYILRLLDVEVYL